MTDTIVPSTTTRELGAIVEHATFRYATGHEEIPTDYGIDEVSFRAEPGTVTLLCGPSGSGKTTALRLLNGLVPHFHPGILTGSVRVGGCDVTTAELHDCAAVSATVFQNPRTQFFTPTVRGELAFASENLGVDPDEILRRMGHAVTTAGIEHLIGRNLAELSGGELQRVACACSIVSGTSVLLFDEPTSNLSPAGISDLRQIIAELKDAGHAIVVAEHRLHFLAGVADTVHLLRDGAIERSFTGAEFFAMPDAERRQAGLRRLTTGSLPHSDKQPAPPPDHSPHPEPRTGLALDNVRFAYGSQQILDIARLTFPAGTVTALNGPNGIGKSTLARLLCGLDAPAKGGSISLDGTTATPAALRRSGYVVMQDTGRQLFAETVEEEVTLGLPRDRRAAIDVPAVLAEFDLAGLGGRHPHALSGGQRQRLVIASASVQDKRVYILDEPTSGVGLSHLETIARHMRRLAADGAVVIVITHDDELIAACADAVVDLSDATVNRAAGMNGTTRDPERKHT